LNSVVEEEEAEKGKINENSAEHSEVCEVEKIENLSSNSRKESLLGW
jgi:hypothetical protein